MTEHAPESHPTINAGLLAGIVAYTIWGIFPIYFMATREVSPMELLAHRIVWSVPFGGLIILARRQIKDVILAFKDIKKLALLTFAAAALAANWGVYIWAIQQDQIFQASLGYYINPLIYVCVGVIFLGERLSRLQGLAVVLAVIGVLTLTIYGGVFPGISLFLAASFTIYGVIRKQVDIGAMPGLFIETLVLLPAGLGYLYWLQINGNMQFMGAEPTMRGLLLLAGPITVLPLLAFAFAARRLTLSSLGFLQYIGPTLQFACGLYFGEVFTVAHALCFSFIWLAVIIFCWDAWRKRRKSRSNSIIRTIA